MQKFMLSFLLLSLSLSAKTLTVYTYDSFASSWGPGGEIKKQFEAKHNCKIDYVVLKGAATLLNRLKLEGKNTKADIVLGLDASHISEAKKLDFAPHNLNTKDLNIPNGWHDEVFLPYDYGYYALVYNSDKIKNPPSSMKEFLSSKHSIIYQNPRTSSVGFGMILWLEKIYGEQSDKAYKQLAKKTISVTKGWSEAYNMFLKGESDFVLSYTTSPIYHIEEENKHNIKAVEFAEGHYMQVEVLGMLASSKEPKLAREFLKFAISKDFAKAVHKNYMYPVADIDLPKAYGEIIKPKKALNIDSNMIEKNSKSWISSWQSNSI